MERIARWLREAEEEYRRAQRLLDGSEESRRRYREAREWLRLAVRIAKSASRFVESVRVEGR